MVAGYRPFAFVSWMLAGFALAFYGSLLGGASAAGLSPQPIDLAKPYQASDYRFLGAAVGARRVVALGESIHVTEEMPLVRLNMVRYLHEELGFDVLAFEGSLMDAWTAQEHAFSSSDAEAARAQMFTREALFGLWQTASMRQVIAYALSTQGSAHPLYLTSFDLQPGMARAYGGSAENSLAAFLATLHAFDSSVSDQQIHGWIKRLSPSLGCESSATNREALLELEQWVEGPVAAAVSAQRPALHVAALKLVPAMLRARLQQCSDWVAANKSMTVYQQSRDALNAKLALALLADSPKQILWAHHSHIHYNSLGQSTPSMGQHLKDALGGQLYTVGVFALGGAAMDTSKAEAAEGLGVVTALAARPLPNDARFSAEHALAGLSKDDFFVDLKAAPGEWTQVRFSRLETNGRMPTALSKDFDGAILLHQVRGAKLDFLPHWLGLAVNMASWIYQHLILAALLALLCLAALARGIRRLWSRRTALKKA